MAHGNYFQGDKHHGAKLTREQVLDILRQRQAGEKVKSLAGRFSVSVSTIESIIYGKAYKDVFVEFRRVEGRG